MTQLIISKREKGDSTVLDLTGDVIFGESNTILRSAVRELIADAHTNISINLAAVGYLDSSGIGELISALTAVNREDGHLQILNPTERVRHIFEISKLTDVFDICFEDGRSPRF